MNLVGTGLQFQVLLGREQIAARVAELAAQISADFRGKELLLLPVLKGAKVFATDLAQQLTIPSQTDYIGVSSYGGGTSTNRSPRLTQDSSLSVTGRNVLIVEDILDSGYTLNFLIDLMRRRQPRELKVVTLLDKPSNRIVPFTADYVGFSIADEFVIGYGLDFNEQYRELPEIYILPPAHASSEQ